MDTTDSAPSALEAIDTVTFKVGLKGYSVDEVDEFLERLSGEVRQMKDLVHQQRQQLRQAAERIAQLESNRPAPTEVASMIALAQRFIEQAQAEAEEKARELTAQAQERAREIVAEARSRAEDEVNRLNGLKQRLGEDVERLRRQLDEQRTRISGVLSEFTHWVEATFSADAAPAPAPVRAVPTPAPAREPSVAPVTEVVPSVPSRPVPPRPSQTPPPAPAPSGHTPTIGQMLRMDQGRDEA